MVQGEVDKPGLINLEGSLSIKKPDDVFNNLQKTSMNLLDSDRNTEQVPEINLSIILSLLILKI